MAHEVEDVTLMLHQSGPQRCKALGSREHNDLNPRVPGESCLKSVKFFLEVQWRKTRQSGVRGYGQHSKPLRAVGGG